jgi:hypothetical protein
MRIIPVAPLPTSLPELRKTVLLLQRIGSEKSVNARSG